MHKARAFFYVCAGVFLLALSYHLGARNAGAQAPGNSVVAAVTGDLYGGDVASAMTANGDVYGFNPASKTWSLGGNVFGGPTPAQQESWGSLKSRYRGSAEPVNDFETLAS